MNRILWLGPFFLLLAKLSSHAAELTVTVSREGGIGQVAGQDVAWLHEPGNDVEIDYRRSCFARGVTSETSTVFRFVDVPPGSYSVSFVAFPEGPHATETTPSYISAPMEMDGLGSNEDTKAKIDRVVETFIRLHDESDFRNVPSLYSREYRQRVRNKTYADIEKSYLTLANKRNGSSRKMELARLGFSGNTQEAKALVRQIIEMKYPNGWIDEKTLDYILRFVNEDGEWRIIGRENVPLRSRIAPHEICKEVRYLWGETPLRNLSLAAGERKEIVVSEAMLRSWAARSDARTTETLQRVDLRSIRGVSDYRQFSRLLVQGGWTSDAAAQVWHEADVCQAVIDSTETSPSIRLSASLKLASLLIPLGRSRFVLSVSSWFALDRNEGTPRVNGVSDPEKGLLLAQELIEADADSAERFLALCLKSLALSYLGRHDEARSQIDEVGKMANTRRLLDMWAVTQRDVLLIQGKIPPEIAEWFLGQAQQDPDSEKGVVCAFIVAAGWDAKATSQFDIEVLQGASELLDEHHPCKEETETARMVLSRELGQRGTQQAAESSQHP